MLYDLLSRGMKIKYALLPHHKRRTQEVSRQNYEADWQNIDPYFTEPKAFILDGQPIQLTTIEFKRRAIVSIVADLIQDTKAESVLEIGSGAGLNLYLLSDIFPGVSFDGIEPTENGVLQAKRLTCHQPNVTIRKGSILDGIEGRYDLIFTSAVLEQLHLYLDETFRNIFAIPAKRYLFYESWLEGINDSKHLYYQLQADYFRESKQAIKKYGAEEVNFWIPLLQPEHMRYSCLVVKR